MSIDCICTFCEHIGRGICFVCKAQWHSRDQNCSWRLCYQTLHGNLDTGHKVIGTGKLRHLALMSKILICRSASQLHLECGLARKALLCTLHAVVQIFS
jgi:hypothetical protein